MPALLALVSYFSSDITDITFFNNRIVRAGLWVATHNPAAAVEIVLPLGIKARAQPDPAAVKISLVRTVAWDIVNQ